MAVERIFKDEASEEKGERARMASFIGAMAIADLVKTTLGPKGMESDISKVQDDEVGDGTTSVVVLAGELLREAEKLVNAKIHPMTIISGFRMAAECARNALLQKVVDNKADSEKFKSDLMKIARTTLSSKILSQDKEHFSKLAVDAVLRLKGSTNLEAIQIIKKPGGSLKDSFLDEGFILDKKIGIGQPKRIENVKILVANTAMDTDKVKIYGARVRVDSMSRVAEIEGAEKDKMREKVQKIIAHGINCFVNRQLIYNFPEELFADAGILAIEHADFDGIERLALVTGGEIASTFDNPESVKLGHCKLIEEIMIGEDKLIHFSGVAMGQACTIVLRGASHHVLDEAERSLHDALCVLSQTVNDSRVLLGGGWPEMIMAKEVDELAKKTPGKKSHAIEAFSRALLAIPIIIADNAGLDSAELIAQLRAEHQKEGSNAGIDVITGSVGDMAKLGISEAFKVKQAVLLSATEAAEMILRVDEIITCAPRRREDRMLEICFEDRARNELGTGYGDCACTCVLRGILLYEKSRKCTTNGAHRITLIENLQLYLASLQIASGYPYSSSLRSKTEFKLGLVNSDLMAEDTPAFNPDLVISQKFPETTYTYSERDATLYALGIGACAPDAVDGDELKYVYHEKGQQFIQVLPTFAALFSLGSISLSSLVQGLEYDPRLLLHGQQYIELYKPLPSSGRIKNKVALAGLHDKGKAAIVEIETKSYNESGELLCMNRLTAFLRGAGGFSTSSRPFSYSKYSANQALLYRLSGDYNPLHSDPVVAKVAGAIIKCICKGDSNMVKGISGRFLLHVYPGETLITEMWLEGMRVIYQAKVKERNRTVLSGFVDLRSLTSSL
ncbi:T-complex protein 1, beta subunit [Parasponia andersonii]|uniref:CCT-beta n=1 Tax=Parasponia andersonii TaxID=3476 RepID=A0A2P5CHV0_PARAD|nr:T-complex protein 1, beta subunit [Parasponia andersonii]